MKKSTLEIIFIILSVIIGAALRFTQLGDRPLDSLEATQALPAVYLFTDQLSPVSSSPIYTGLTGILFTLFGDSDFSARFLPAFLGVLFILVPLLFQHHLGKATSIVLMYFLAFDPFLIYLSREAGSGMVAITAVLCFFAALEKRKAAWLGITGIMTVLSGPLGFTGLAAIGGAVVWMRGQVFDNPEEGVETRQSEIKWGQVLFSAAISLLIFGMLFAITPWIINGFGSGIIDAFQGWVYAGELQSQGVLTRIMLSLLILMPLTFILGITGLIRGLINKDRFSGFLSRWALIAFVIILVYPQHRVTDLAWVSIPLCVAAAVEIQKWVHRPDSHRLVSFIFSIACILLLIFCSLKIPGLLVYEPGSADYQLALAGIALTLLMLAVSAFLIGWGWSWKVAFYGLGVGAVVVLSIFSISMSRRAAGLGGARAANILLPGIHPQELGLIHSTLDDLSRQDNGIPGELEVVVLRINDPSLRWRLRDYPAARFVDDLAPGEAPQVLITEANEDLQLPASYRGQDFARSAIVPWTLLTGKEWMRWILFGEGPLQRDYVILWARNDLFPEGSSSVNE